MDQNKNKDSSNRALSFNKDPSSPLPSLSKPTPAAAAAAVFFERGQRIKVAAEMGLARSSGSRHWGRALRCRLPRQRGSKVGGGGGGGCGCKRKALDPPKVEEELVGGGGGGGSGEGEDEAEEIERRVRALQRLVPGGEELGTDRLFEETANYIEALQGQVSLMTALANLLDGYTLERERRMVGG